MSRSWRLGTAFGIGIFVHWTFLLLLGWVLYTTGLNEAGVVVSALVLAVFGCVVLHELGHALMAQHFGIRTRDITLYPIGGVARLERMSERPMEELLIALAGPAVNVVIAILLFGILEIMNVAALDSFVPSMNDGHFLNALLEINVCLVLFNLIPAFPMDGGRVLRAVLASRLGLPRATRIAAGLGAVLACAIFAYGLIMNAPMAMMVGIFVYFAGQQELAAVRRREEERAWQAWNQGAPASDQGNGAVHPNGSAHQPSFSGYIWDAQTGTWLIYRDGRPVGSMPMQ